ncbi:hypothetical protein D5086_017723 [Populus alba]|uniref:Uncharacterized protein n=1 Tax=Populus alba TaxID=43335 RepID=A0ACC4BPT9_POPAL
MISSIKALSYIRLSSKNVSTDGTDLSSTSSKVSSLSVPPTPRSEGEILQSSNLKSFSFSDLKMATRNFRPDSVLGEGGFGSVFKGWIDEQTFAAAKPGTGMVIAVKRLNQDGFQGHKEWLIFILHDMVLFDDFRKSFHVLSVLLRISFALLFQKYNAKLSDFGLAKDGPTGDKSHVSTRVMGTYGYAAPEYLATGHLTSKSDVYSFGVVLLEMLSGRRAVDKNRPSGEHNLVEWAKPYLANKRKIFRILDNRLEGQYSMDVAYKVSTLALRCLSIETKIRPTMDEVVTALEQLQDSKETGTAIGHVGNKPRIRRRSANDATGGGSTAAYPRPSASPLYA